MEERWEERLRIEENRLIEVLKVKYRKKNKTIESKSEFLEKVDDAYDGVEDLKGKHDSYYLNSNYLYFLMKDADASETLMNQVGQNL